MKICYDNHVTNATITAYSENPDYDFDTALNDTRLSRVGRTVNDTTQWIQFSFTAAVDVDYIFVLAHNVTSGATIKVQANATDSWGSPSIDTAMTYDADYLYHAFSSTESYQYWRFYVDDGSNPDGYIELGAIWLAEAIDAPAPTPDGTFPKKSNSVATKSTAGQLYGDKRLQYKAAAFNFADVTDAERTVLNTFWETVDVVEPFILMIWPESFDVEAPIYCNLTKELEWAKQVNEGLLFSLTLEFEEVF